MAKKKKATINSEQLEYSKQPDVSNPMSNQQMEPPRVIANKPISVNPNKSGEIMVHSPFVHPSAGLVSMELHNAIIAINRSLGMNGGAPATVANEIVTPGGKWKST